MNNGLLAVMLPADEAAALLADAGEAADAAAPLQVEIDIDARVVRTARRRCSLVLSDRQRRMLLEGLDMIGTSVAHAEDISAFAERHGAEQPSVRDVARRTMQRSSGADVATRPLLPLFF